MNLLTPLEQAVMDLILDKTGEPFDTIRKQLSHATIARRQFDGMGFLAPTLPFLPTRTCGAIWPT